MNRGDFKKTRDTHKHMHAFMCAPGLVFGAKGETRTLTGYPAGT